MNSNKYQAVIAYGATHCHTDCSNAVSPDSCATIPELVKRAKELGAPAVCLTDHGVTIGWDTFNAECLKAGIKPVDGVEAYVESIASCADGSEEQLICHLVLMAKNLMGRRQISKAMASGVLVGNKGVAEDAGKGSKVVLTKESLSLLKGGNVICTSACIQGPFGAPLLFNQKINRKTEKAEKEARVSAEAEAEYRRLSLEAEELVEKLAILKESLKESKKASKASLVQKEKVLAGKVKKLEELEAVFVSFLAGDTKLQKKLVSGIGRFEVEVIDSDFEAAITDCRNAVRRAKAKINVEKAVIEKAAEAVKAREKEIEEIKSALAAKKIELAPFQKAIAQSQKRAEKSQSLLGKKIPKEEVLKLYSEWTTLLLGIFGKDFYMEVQNHGIPEEAEIYPFIAKYARKMGIKLIAANDVHVVRNSEEDFLARQIRRSCRFNRWDEEQPGDREYYLKTDGELYEALVKILPEDMAREAMDNIEEMVAKVEEFQPDKESHAPKAKVENVGAEIERLARKGIAKKYGKGWTEKHEERLRYELGIIDSMGYNDYFYITNDILYVSRLIGGLSYENLDWLKENVDEMTIDELFAFLKKNGNQPNLSIGLGRGSGAGSIVCYLLGITNVDPIKYDLLFERFLNPERISMPDIDSDLRTDIKDVVLSYLKKRYGDRAIAQILTCAYSQGKSAIDTVKRILADRDSTPEKEVRYDAIADKLKAKAGVDFGRSLAENREALMEGAEGVEAEIVKDACLIDGTLDHTGIHAAGTIISDNADLADYVPVVWNEKAKTWVAQCDMVQAEKVHGLLKMDLLLLNTLDIITFALRTIKKTHPGVKIDIENLPMEEKIFREIYGKGDTKSVFQFESSGMMGFLKQLNPTRIEDVVAANAMYRPGPMDSIPDFLEAKRTGRIVYDCPQLEPILKETYGCIVYQEQVMRIVRDLAGYSMGRSDLVRRAMAKKHMDELNAERQNFIYGNTSEGIHGCVAIGIKAETANKIFDKMIKFAEYA